MSYEPFEPCERYKILKFIKEQPGSVSYFDLVYYVENTFNKTITTPIDFCKEFTATITNSTTMQNLSYPLLCLDKNKSDNGEIVEYFYTNSEYRIYIDNILEIKNFHYLDKNEQNIINNVDKLKDNSIYVIDKIKFKDVSDDTSKNKNTIGTKIDTETYNGIATFLGKEPKDQKYNNPEIYVNNRYLLGRWTGYLIKNFDNRKYKLNCYKSNVDTPIFFVGQKTIITDPSFDFENCVFLSNEVEFNYNNNKIKLSKENNAKDIFSFRDAHFNCKKIVFNNLQIYGDENGFESEISFEDAQFYCDEIIFNKSVFVNAKVNFFQTQLNSNSNANANDKKYFGCTFIECVFKNSYIDFEDSKIKVLLSFININDFPNANFLFNEAENLMLHNCILNNRIKIANTKKLSLKSSISSDIIETPFVIKDKLDSNKKARFNVSEKFKTFWNIDYGNYDIIKAIVDNNDSEKSKASQLALLKESYHSLGQYEAEDIAFGASRKYGESNKFVNFILSLSNYGTNSIKFFVIVFICIIIIPVIIYLLSIFCLSFSDYEGFLRVFLDSFSDFFLTNYDESGNILDNIFSAILGLIGLFAFGYLLTIVIKKLDR